MIVDKIQEYIGDHSAPGVLFVIKGYAFTEFESCATSLGKTIEDKGSRFMEILQQPTKVICYEEFICLREIMPNAHLRSKDSSPQKQCRLMCAS